MHDGGDTSLRQLRALLDELDAVSTTLSANLDDLRGATAQVRTELDAGRPLHEIHAATGIGAVRDRVSNALVRVNEALRATRAEFVRVIVDHEGLMITEVARRTGRSRQFLTRLLEDGRRNAADRETGESVA